MADLDSFLSTATNLSKSFVSITGTVGIAGFVFDISNDSIVELDSEITDHYLEDGTPIEDHIAMKPERVTLSGYCGEYRNIVSDKKGTVQKVAEKLITVSSYLPALSKGAKAAYKLLTQESFDSLTDALDTGSDLFKAYKGINIPHDNQSQAFIFFEALRNARKTFTIQTPYRYYTDMAIESLKATQTGLTKDESNFEITFKRIRYVNTKTTSLSQSLIDKAQGRLKNMAAPYVNKGIAKGKQLASTALKSFWG